MSSRKVLGRGLDALIPQEPLPQEGGEAGQIHWIPVDRIVPNPRQPRTRMDESRLEELTRSIQEKGIIEPLIVRPMENGTYELVAGERRLRAAQRGERSVVPALFRVLTDRDSLEIALIENLQREDLNPVDEARAYQRLVDDFQRTHSDISKEVGKDRSTITNMLRLLRLPNEVLEQVSRGTLSAGHARVLLTIDKPDEQKHLAQRMVDEGWSVRQAEKHLSQSESPKDSRAPAAENRPTAQDREVVRVEEAIQYALGTQVRLHHSPKGGRIEIRYHSNEELDRILDLLGIEVH